MSSAAIVIVISNVNGRSCMIIKKNVLWRTISTFCSLKFFRTGRLFPQVYVQLFFGLQYVCVHCICMMEILSEKTFYCYLLAVSVSAESV